MTNGGLSIFFLTYNRADLLRIACGSLAASLGDAAPWRIQTIISDDGSSEEHQAIITDIPADIRLFGPNRGLSANHNRAIEACAFDRILSIQDDWEFLGTLQVINAAMEILDEDPEVGCVNFLEPSEPLDHEQRWTRSGQPYLVFSNDGIHKIRLTAQRPYSDRPHLKRHVFARDLGRYREDLPMTKAELEFQRRVACQERWKIAYLTGPTCFGHIGGERSFNPGALRQARIEKFQALPLIGPLYGWMREAAKAVLRNFGLRS